MGRKLRLNAYQLSWNGSTPAVPIFTQDMSVSNTSDETNVGQFDLVHYRVNWAGASPDGTMTIQYANIQYPQQKPDSLTTWTDIDFGSPITLSGVSGAHEIVITENHFEFLRINYVANGGSVGTLTITIDGATKGA